MIIIKVDCCGRPQMLCGLSVWTSSDAMWAKGLNNFNVSLIPLTYLSVCLMLLNNFKCIPDTS